MRADRAGRAVRLVALSGYGLPEDLKRSESAGFDAHLVKPVDPVKLSDEDVDLRRLAPAGVG